MHFNPFYFYYSSMFCFFCFFLFFFAQYRRINTKKGTEQDEVSKLNFDFFFPISKMKCVKTFGKNIKDCIQSIMRRMKCLP